MKLRDIREQVAWYYKRYLIAFVGMALVIIIVPLLSGLLDEIEGGDMALVILGLSSYVCIILIPGIPVMIFYVKLRRRKFLAPLDSYKSRLDILRQEQFERDLQEGYRLENAVMTGECIVVSFKFYLFVIPYGDITGIYGSGSIPSQKNRTLLLETRKTPCIQIILGKEESGPVIEEFVRLLQEKVQSIAGAPLAVDESVETLIK